MESEQKLAVLQNVYAAAIAETVNTYQVLGFLAAIEQRKQERQEQTAPYMLAQLGISTVEDVFSRLSSIFGCANWNVEYEESGYRAVATTCKLCALSKNGRSLSLQGVVHRPHGCDDQGPGEQGECDRGEYAHERVFLQSQGKARVAL